MKQRVIFGLTCFAVLMFFYGCCIWTQSSKPMQLTITFETNSTDGRFSPRNVHAVWVEAADGTFIKTLGLWGGNRRARNLTEWTSTIGDYDNEIQARTGATERAYGTYTVQWDMKDAAGIEVPDGDYNIRFELTSDNASQDNFHRATISFKKTHTMGTTDPIDQGGYTNIVLDYEVVAIME